MKLFLNNRFLFRYLFIGISVLIAVGSLIVSHYFVEDLAQEEKNKIEIWAEATSEVASSEESTNMNLIIKILGSNTTIPVILYDEKDDYYISSNIDLPSTSHQQEFLREKANRFKKKKEPIVISTTDFNQYVYYDDSHTLKRLQLYPYVQLAVLAVVIVIAFLALLSTMRMEQDRVWVGLSKETAHQLGTPISSLLAWIELLRIKDVDPSILNDMDKDINRLQVITDRFSKIGSTPTLECCNLNEEVCMSIAYLSKRISKKVIFNEDVPSVPLYANISKSLFSWVLENLTKNAVDAMNGEGSITFTLASKITSKGDVICLDMTDTGKGIPKSKFDTIFSPGYTTKSRGWGLGLSLARRIIEVYHKGRIFVKASELNKGTTFRIELKKVDISKLD